MPAKAHPNAGDEEREDDGGSGVLVGGLRGEREKARADDGADTQRDQIHRAERALQLVRAALAFAQDAGDAVWLRKGSRLTVILLSWRQKK